MTSKTTTHKYLLLNEILDLVSLLFSVKPQSSIFGMQSSTLLFQFMLCFHFVSFPHDNENYSDNLSPNQWVTHNLFSLSKITVANMCLLFIQSVAFNLLSLSQIANTILYSCQCFQGSCITTTLKSKLGFYVPFNSQGHIGTGPQNCHLWDSNPQR